MHVARTRLAPLTHVNKILFIWRYQIPSDAILFPVTTGLSYIFVWVSKFNWLAHSGSESVIWCLLLLYAGSQQSDHLHSRVSGEVYCREPPAASSHCLRLLWSWWEFTTACSFMSISMPTTVTENTLLPCSLAFPRLLSWPFSSKIKYVIKKRELVKA